jgi:hypothetical protein
MEQVIPVLCKMHCPHIWQSKTASLPTFSTQVTAGSNQESGFSQRRNGIKTRSKAS